MLVSRRYKLYLNCLPEAPQIRCLTVEKVRKKILIPLEYISWKYFHASFKLILTFSLSPPIPQDTLKPHIFLWTLQYTTLRQNDLLWNPLEYGPPKARIIIWSLPARDFNLCFHFWPVNPEFQILKIVGTSLPEVIYILSLPLAYNILHSCKSGEAENGGNKVGGKEKGHRSLQKF